MKDQSEKVRPVNFLKTWSSFKKYKKKLIEQKSIIKDIEINLALEGNIKISSDTNERKIDIDNLNSEKRNVVDATRKTINNQLIQKTTNFRTKIMERAKNQKDLKQYHPYARGSGAHSSLVPSAPADMPSSYSNPSRGFRGEDVMEKKDEKFKVKKKIEDLLDSYHKTVEQQSKLDSIATEAVQRSLFGVFAHNYSIFKNEAQSSTIENVFKKVFKGSQILNDVYRIILYFNLPFHNYTEPKIPDKIFTLTKDESIKAMLEKFEKKGLTLQQPNVIIMRVEKDLVVGGYASHGWSISENQRGDDTCFLFNIKQNFRFSAVPGKKYYQETISKDGFKFGSSDLVVENDFKSVTSEILGDYFVFGTHLLQNKLDSLIPDRKQFEPQEVEVWTFN